MTFLRQMKKAKHEGERLRLRKQSLDYMERYLYLIIFNAYLHYVRRHTMLKFSVWLQEVRCWLYEHGRLAGSVNAT